MILHGNITGWPPRYDAVSVGGVQRREQCTALGKAGLFFLRRKYFLIYKYFYLPTPRYRTVAEAYFILPRPVHCTAGALWKTRFLTLACLLRPRPPPGSKYSRRGTLRVCPRLSPFLLRRSTPARHTHKGHNVSRSGGAPVRARTSRRLVADVPTAGSEASG